jgi:hypothetical protein
MSWTQDLLDLIACKIECNHFTQKLKLMEKMCSMFLLSIEHNKSEVKDK